MSWQCINLLYFYATVTILRSKIAVTNWPRDKMIGYLLNELTLSGYYHCPTILTAMYMYIRWNKLLWDRWRILQALKRVCIIAGLSSYCTWKYSMGSESTIIVVTCLNTYAHSHFDLVNRTIIVYTNSKNGQFKTHCKGKIQLLIVESLVQQFVTIIVTRKPSCRWQTRATLAKSVHGLRKSSGVVSCIARLAIDSLPMVFYYVLYSNYM